MANVTLNEINIKNKIGKTLQEKRFAALAYNAANTRFIAAKQNLLNEYDNHQITKELNDGAGAQGSVIGYGNIYSLLGFNIGDTPAQDLRVFIEKRLNLINNPKFSNNINRSQVTYSFPVQSPSLTEIYNNDKFAMPDDWSTKAWPEAIEQGIGTFASYIYHEFFGNESRSKTGLQRKNPRQGIKDKVLGIKWISEIFSNFRERFR